MATIYPPYSPVPRDPVDHRYAISFDAEKTSTDGDAAIFFEEYGFVVIRNIFTNEECANTRDAMWSIIEKSHKGFDRNVVSTWDTMKVSGKYGLSTRGPCFDRILVQNRQNLLLANVLAALIGTPVTDLMVSHDRFTIYRATVLPESECSSGSDGSKYTTGERNVHLDLNPWWWAESSTDILRGVETLSYEDPQDFIRENNMVVECMGRHVQCVLNFADNVEEDGGTVIVPQFHKHIRPWCSENISLRKNLPFLTFNKPTTASKPADMRGNADKMQPQSPRVCAGDSQEITGEGGESYEGRINTSKNVKVKRRQKSCASAVAVDHEAPLLALAQRIPMRQGSVLIWDQTMFHGSAPNTSTKCRMAQFLKAFPRSKSFPSTRESEVGGSRSAGGCLERSETVGSSDGADSRPRLLRRALALVRELELAESLDSVSALGRTLFGLDVLGQDPGP